MPAIIAQPGMPLWIDLASQNLAESLAFYQALLGWEIEKLTDEYALAKKDGMPVAGLAQVPSGNVTTWSMSLYTPDVQDAHDKAVQAGAISILPPTGMERADMAIIQDPCGAVVGLKRPADEVALFAAGEPGTPVWHELMVGREWEATAKFYHELAGWDVRAHASEDEFRYAIGEFEGAPLVGMWDTADSRDENAPAGVSAWTLYMGVGDVDEALRRTVEAGGQVVRPAFDSEFGRVASILDNQGALLNLCQVEEYVPSEDEVHEPDLFAPEDFRSI